MVNWRKPTEHATDDGPGTLSHSRPCGDDRWVEVDLQWFNREDIDGSTREFWRRFAPLFDGVTGWKGVILNVAWVMDYVLDWRGIPDADVPSLPHMRPQKWFSGGRTAGATADRKARWHERFDSSVPARQLSYRLWSYRKLAELIQTLRQVGRECGLPDIRIGSFVIGWASAYGGRPSGFAARHPEIYRPIGVGQLNAVATLVGDSTSYGGWPDGVPEGTPIHEFFAAQWGSLSRSMGLDAIVLRDSMIGPAVYDRGGPYGTATPPDPAAVAAWSAATAALIRATKMANPDALVAGYSSAASAVADWSVNCVDLEQIAHEGYLDIWIDQSWAGAWNEVAARQEGFWNGPHRGWTYQLAFILLHAAMLVETTVRHYVLVETWDSWESWDVIHTVPERLRWAIWAYLHAAVKTPWGLKMPAGSYVSWANQGQTLLPAADVRFLHDTIGTAARDARGMIDVAGPTLIYSRPTMEWQSAHAPQQNIGQWIDEQAGGVMKWSIPILSATRVEYLPTAHSDLLIMQTPIHLADPTIAHLARLVEQGAVAIFGSPAGGVDGRLAKLAGLYAGESAGVTSSIGLGQLGDGWQNVTRGIPFVFAARHTSTKSEALEGARIIYQVDDSPALVVRPGTQDATLIWDPPELHGMLYDAGDRPLAARLGGIIPYVLTARTLNEILRAGEHLAIEDINPATPVVVLSWSAADGARAVLAADLDEGVIEDDESDRHLRLTLPTGSSDSPPPSVCSPWNEDAASISSAGLNVRVGRASSVICWIPS